jgi:long-chain acyl-CoA synthetase
MKPASLIGHVAAAVEAHPASIAVASATGSVTYREMWERVLVAADLLRDHGVRPGDRVLLAAAREPEFLYAYLACHLGHAVAVPYDADLTPSRLQSIVDLVAPRVVVATKQPAAPVTCASFVLPTLTGCGGTPRASRVVEPAPECPADILLTSGTTGCPKGVILSHRNILAAARNINQFIGNTADDREGVALPLNHSFGLGRVRCQLLAGGALILTPGFQFPKQTFELMRTWRATGFSFVPAAWAMLKRLTGERMAEFSTHLRYVEIGSASMPKAEKEHLMRMFPRTRICMHYGLTEASRSAFIEFHESRDRLDSIGKPAPNVAVRIVDDEGRVLGPHHVGRIQISGDHVMAGYWGADAEERLEGTWLRSGDLGYRADDGYLYVCGREDDVINVGGRKVHPLEVEQALLRQERVADAVCVVTRDPVTGEAVRALLVARPGDGDLPSAEALTDFLLPRLEKYKIPVGFEWVPAIPTNASGKVVRKLAADLVGTPAG